MEHPIELAAKVFTSKRALAKRLGVSPQAITKWKNSRIPAERVLEIERISGVARQTLRPDLYPYDKRVVG